MDNKCKNCKFFYQENKTNKCTNLVYYGENSTNIKSIPSTWSCGDFTKKENKCMT